MGETNGKAAHGEVARAEVEMAYRAQLRARRLQPPPRLADSAQRGQVSAASNEGEGVHGETPTPRQCADSQHRHATSRTGVRRQLGDGERDWSRSWVYVRSIACARSSNASSSTLASTILQRDGVPASRPRAISAIARLCSMPTTRPSGPTAEPSKGNAAPVPQATSKTVSPGRSSSAAMAISLRDEMRLQLASYRAARRS